MCEIGNTTISIQFGLQPSAYQHPSILALFFWSFSVADGSQWEWGLQLQCWEYTSRQSERDQERAHVCSWKQSLSQAGPTHSWKAARPVGQSLIGKQQRFVSTAMRHWDQGHITVIQQNGAVSTASAPQLPQFPLKLVTRHWLLHLGAASRW